MIQVSGFGEDAATIPATVGEAKLYREHLEGRLRKNSYVLQSKENPSGERRNFMTALAIGMIFGHRWPCSFPDRYRIRKWPRNAAGLSWPGWGSR